MDKEAVFRSAAGFSYTVIRCARQSIAITIQDGKVFVRLPYRADLSRAGLFIAKKTPWILRHLSQYAMTARPEFRVGSVLPYLGRELVIAEAGGSKVIFDLDNAKLLVPEGLSQSGLESAIARALYAQAGRVLFGMLKDFAAKRGLSFSDFALTKAKRKWGSCSSSRKIMLHWKLIFLSEALIRYVIAHECAHLSQMNHGPLFWKKVSEYCPEFKSLRQSLRDGGMPIMPWER